MRDFRIYGIILLVILLSSMSTAIWSQWEDGYDIYTDTELDEILAPIALYPDPLLAQILPAATYPDQLIDADNYLQQSRGVIDIDWQDWDISVKAVAYYPSVLRMMVDNIDWTISVGQVYIDVPDQVMISIQRLRERAREYGYLQSNNYHSVYLDSGFTRIVPIQNRYIYVPQYDPHIVFVTRRSSYSSSWISFGLGLLIGSWLNRDCDWPQRRIYYHDWRGRGWVDRCRPFVNTRNTHYVNRRFLNRDIDVDRRVRSRDISSYRTRIKRNAGSFQLPEFRRLDRTRDIRDGGRTSGRQRIERDTPRLPGQRDPDQSPRSRDRMPSVIPPPRSDRVETRPPTRPGQGTIDRRPSDRTRVPSVTPPPRSNRIETRPPTRPGQGTIDRRPSGGARVPTVTPPRSNRINTNPPTREKQSAVKKPVKAPVRTKSELAEEERARARARSGR
ncbi:MAG: DUF3300 domain-containing protein [Armatimonadota bacterium]